MEEEPTYRRTEYERGDMLIVEKEDVSTGERLYFGIGKFRLAIDTPEGRLVQTQMLPFPIKEGNVDRAFRMWDKAKEEFRLAMNEEAERERAEPKIVVPPAGARVPRSD
jgi:hypothetical protein